MKCGLYFISVFNGCGWALEDGIAGVVFEASRVVGLINLDPFSSHQKSLPVRRLWNCVNFWPANWERLRINNKFSFGTLLIPAVSSSIHRTNSLIIR